MGTIWEQIGNKLGTIWEQFGNIDLAYKTSVFEQVDASLRTYVVILGTNWEHFGNKCALNLVKPSVAGDHALRIGFGFV